MRRCVRRWARRKHGQTTWSPLSRSAGAAPANGVSAQEMMQIIYRPLPPKQTVEYEEDFGRNLVIQREYVSERAAQRASFEMTGLAYSDVELRRGRAQLAEVMNRERKGAEVGQGANYVPRDVDLDPDTRELRSARYLFNEPRMQYCERFQSYLRDRRARLPSRNASNDPLQQAAQNSSSSSSNDEGDEGHVLFSLMEACAIIYGCTNAAAREVYYEKFANLDLDSLERDEAALRERIATATELQAQFSSKEDTNAVGTQQQQQQQQLAAAGSKTPLSECEAVQQLIDSLPPVLESTPTTTAAAAATNTRSTSTSNDTSEQPDVAGRTHTNNSTTIMTSSSSNNTRIPPPSVRLSAEFAEYAPLYKAYLSHARGESAVGSYDTSSIGATAMLAERRRWRALMEKLVQEDYHTVTEDKWSVAAVLNEQLHTIKFLDLKVGDTVAEIMQLLQRETGDGSSLHRTEPVAAAATHPERRE